MTVAPIGTRVMTSTPAAMTMSLDAGHDGLGGEVGRLLGGAALPVDGGAHHRLGEPGGEGGVAAHVEALLADLHDAAHDHVLDQGGIEVVAG